MKKTKIIWINMIVFLSLLFTPSLLFSFYKYLKLEVLTYFIGFEGDGEISKTALSPLYDTLAEQQNAQDIMSESWPEKHYRSFIGWRANAHNSKNINIVGPYNTRLSLGSSINDSTWFFGGSTMWGMGVSDANTIPSYYNQYSGEKVYNFGEMAWVSRQSLNELISAIGDHNLPRRVIFYDGVNDVIHGCRTELEYVPSHSREAQINAQIANPLGVYFNSKMTPISDFVSAPYKAFLGKLGASFSQPLGHGLQNCSSDPLKAQRIAKHLVNNWYTAYLIARDAGASFNAVLQPVAFLESPDVSYLIDGNNNNYLKSEFDSVYPIVKELMESSCLENREFCNSLIDATQWLDGGGPVFFDFCHLTPRGNSQIALQLVNNL